MDVLRRRVVQEDAVQYKLFLTEPVSSTDIEDHLSCLVEEILAKIAPLSMQYIWQKQPFNIKYYPEKGGVPAHIGGSTQFGDNVEDEWFIVYLLKHITEAFPGLVARVEDNDGEFLLIEVADHLPKWLNPDTSENRVFIYRGVLHLLPCPSRSNPTGIPKDVVPSIQQAITLLSSQPGACRASSKITSSLDKRLDGYPEKIGASLHHAHCFIPAGVAMVLAQRPDLVAPAVSAFYLRDPIDLQACRDFKNFPPDTRVLTSVTFTRCLYAQLQQQQFIPDKRSGFTMPLRSDPRYKSHELGMKLAHGFEILCSKCKMPSSEDDSLVSCNPQWKRFLQSLKSNGYFREEIEGSAHYRELMTSAENFFKQSVASTISDVPPGEEVLQLLSSCGPINMDELRKQEAQLPQEDNDNWLDVTAQDLERMLEERSGSAPDIITIKHPQTVRPAEEAAGCTLTEDSEKVEEAACSLAGVSEKMKEFLNTKSSYMGAELPWNCSSNNPFTYDTATLISELERILDTNEEDSLDSDDICEDEWEEVGDDDDDEIEEESSAHMKMNGMEALDTLKGYMDQMDQELTNTNIGQSFNQMTSSSVRPPGKEGSPSPATAAGDADQIQPLDVDLNLVTNLLESLSSQEGLAGPASNLLQSIGIHLPLNSDRS
ncbi:protein ecdysoneless homolog [Corythoichthys intestinalis]|uniref:protein ecdysoneless homolog n=1 Tax=Corythoichthys intestinalis TaxID=161448 RepID=UPI0025A5B7C9|nr:protein ecdysoneless homolog [Corythoichthys intestinalis]